jgi:hypothetical protein
MRCELCSSGQREHGRRLCLPCMEAVARLWTITNRTIEPLAGEIVKAQPAVKIKYAPIVALRPNISLL